MFVEFEGGCSAGFLYIYMQSIDGTFADFSRINLATMHI